MNNTNMSPRVSVVIAAYNEENTIARTVQSLVGQTMDNFEIIVVDDGSTDDTAEVVSDFTDQRIRLITTDQNQGLPEALNRGIYAAKGEYIARADADERSLPYRLQHQSEVLNEQPDVQAVGCWYTNVGRDGKRIVDKRISTDRSFSVRDLLENGTGVAHGSMMIRTDALSKVGGYREAFQLAQDYDLWLRMAETFGPGWLHVVSSVLYERTIEASQLQKRYRQRVYSDAAQECARVRQKGRTDVQILEDLPERVKRAANPQYTQRELEGMYYYLLATKLLAQNQQGVAQRYLVKALWFAPKRPRPWYRFVLSCLSSDQRQTIQDWVKKRL
jgi:glycosyltransferase involved in cell wall biosynthesis